MDTTPFTNSQIVAAFEDKTRHSKARHLEARDVFPSGIVHDARDMKPHPIYIERAEGARKWDADGNEYVDYFGGHGSLLLGHAHTWTTSGEMTSRSAIIITEPEAE